MLAEARDNVAFGTPDEWAGLAEPDGVPVVEQDLWRDELLAMPTADKIALAKELERLTLAADSRVRVDEADYADVQAEGAVATSTGIATSGRETGAYLSVSTLADDGDVTQTGFGFTVGRSPADFDPEKAAREAAERATRLLGATKPATGKVTVVLDPFVSAQLLGIIGSTLNGEAVLKGRSIFADRVGEDVAAPDLTLIDDPTNPLAYTASEIDGEGLATRRNVLIEGGVLQKFVQSSYSARRSGTAPTGNATRGGFKSTPGCGCLALSLVPGTRSQAELIADVDDGVLIQMVQGLHSGVNPVSGDFSTGASGLHDPRRPAGRAGAGVHDRLDAAADAEGRRRGGRRRRLAADERGRRLARHPRRHHERGLTEAWRPRRPRPGVGPQRTRWDGTRTSPRRCPPAGSGSTCTPTPCGRATRRRRPRSSSEAVTDCGLDVLCITDHNAVKGAQELAGRLPCRVVVGEELRTHAGEIIGLFLTEHVPFGVSPEEAAQRIREQGGLVYVPHPFDPMRRNLAEPALVALTADGLVDAIEVFNAKTSLRHLNDRAAAFAADHDLAAGAGSDAHVPDALGAAYVEMPDFDGPADFLAKLRGGPVVGHHVDPHRAWRPRIVPSTSA